MSVAPPPGLKPKKIVQVISNMAPVDKSSNKMSNNDFRAMLERSKETKAEEAKERKSAEARAGREETRRKKKTARAESYKKWQAKKAMKEEEHRTKYRDRASERRNDENPDYEAVDVKEYEEVDIEKSKYLGGDVKHTHLVKGLDYALLQKRRGEIEENEEERMEREYMESQNRKKLEAQKKLAEEKTLTFVSNFGRRIHHHAIEAPLKIIGQKLETFLPGRMTFEFDLDQNFGSALPTTLLQSRNDCPEAEEKLSGHVAGDITRRLDRILSLLSHGSKYGRKGKRKKEKKNSKRKKFEVSAVSEDDEDEESRRDSTEGVQDEEEEKAPPSRVEDSDDDIFADAGRDYECDLKPKEENSTSNTYFGEDDESVEVSMARKNDEMERQIAKLTRQQEDRMKDERMKEKKQTKSKDEQDPNYVDSYMECYPSSYGGNRSGFVVDDNSDDEDLTKMDQGRSKVRPWDFQSENEWSEFNDNREAVPKAAFQFGLKMKDGRKNKGDKIRSAKDKERDKEAKFEREFSQITQIMNKRGPKKGSNTARRSEKRQKILKGFKSK